MQQKTLVTTAIEQTWNDSGENIFLGEWCKKYSRHEEWNTIKHKTILYHWDDREELEKDYLYLGKMYEDYLLIISDYLNKKHQTNHGLTYWRIIIGPWLGQFIHILYDRWYMLSKGVEDYDIDYCNILIQDPSRFVANDMDEFIHESRSDQWNENIYSQLLLTFFKGKVVLKNIIPSGNLKKISANSHNSNFNFVRLLLGKLLGVGYNNCKYFFYKTYLPRLTNIKTQAFLGQVPKLWTTILSPYFPIDKDSRKFQLNNKYDDNFSKVLSYMLIKNIPKAYLEGYKELVQISNSLKWPERPKVIFTANAFHSDEVFKVWAAQKVERGSKMVTIQHGGLYGMSPFNFSEDLQLSLSHKFISWGWTHDKKIIPFGIIKTLGLSVKPKNDGLVLLVGNSLPRYSQYIQCHPVAVQNNRYFDDQFSFIKQLPVNMKGFFKVRLFPYDHGYDLIRRYEEMFPEVDIDTGNLTLYSMIEKSRLVVVDANETVYLESLSINFPTVVFWNQDYWEINEESKPYFELLKKVKVFHDTPESAAQHISSIWKDVSLWWELKETQDAVYTFCNHFCADVKNPSKELAKILSGSVK